MNWFYIVLIVLLAIGVHGLWRGVGSLYFWGWYLWRPSKYKEGESEQERQRFTIKYPTLIASMADSITLIVGVVLFFWLLR